MKLKNGPFKKNQYWLFVSSTYTEGNFWLYYDCMCKDIFLLTEDGVPKNLQATFMVPDKFLKLSNCTEVAEGLKDINCKDNELVFEFNDGAMVFRRTSFLGGLWYMFNEDLCFKFNSFYEKIIYKD